MNDMEIARALHVLALTHWIGGVAFVTLVVLPGLVRAVPPSERLRMFELIENRFARQAKLSTLAAGLSGLYMVHVADAWERFSSVAYFWMHAMVAIWLVFSVVLYVAEPLFLHRWFHERAESDPEGTFDLVLRLHRVLLSASLATIATAVLGAHGAFL